MASAALALAAVQAIEGVRYLDDAQYLSVLLFMASFLGVLASLKMWRGNSFGSRFTLAVIAVAAIVGHTLSLIVGLPGSTMDPWTSGQGLFDVVALATAIVILVVLLPHFFPNRTEPGSRTRYDA
ncbi:hypothetical protein [Arthrobacter monumenti]